MAEINFVVELERLGADAYRSRGRALTSRTPGQDSEWTAPADTSA